eukprot:scaffold21342_cov66-Cyclotella_meneghiniana.AAC.5
MEGWKDASCLPESMTSKHPFTGSFLSSSLNGRILYSSERKHSESHEQEANPSVAREPNIQQHQHYGTKLSVKKCQ